MRKAFWILVVLMFVPSWAAAAVDVKVHVNIPLPPAIVFPAPPQMVVIPGTYVYAAPHVGADIFFYGGWWWRPWEGRWYRSRNHDRGWVHYRSVPAFYKQVPPRWRQHYRERRWNGRDWTRHHVSHRDMERSWRDWERKKHWEKQNHWGLRDPQVHRRDARADRHDGPPSHKRGPDKEHGNWDRHDRR